MIETLEPPERVVDKTIPLVNRIKELIDFIEILEYTTTDPVTSQKIREFLLEKEIW